MNLSPPHPVTRQPWTLPAGIATVFTLLLLAGCGPCGGPAGGGGDGKSMKTAATCRQSEFDYYCNMRPADAARGLSKDRQSQPFAPTVYAAMRARGYKVYLVEYTWRHVRGPFYPVSRGLPGGYGLRDFFGTPAVDTIATQPAARSAATNNNASAGGRVGYGLRHFFGLDGEIPEPQVSTGTRTAVVWETSKGEFFLVDHYYAAPIWLDGKSWLEKVRFYDSAAVSVEVMKS